jgi:hypothetical protein
MGNCFSRNPFGSYFWFSKVNELSVTQRQATPR